MTRLLLDALKQGGIAAAGFKPFCCGGRQDSILLHQGSAEGPGFTLDEINPVWLKTPASPFTAALIENRKLDFPALHRSLENLTSRVDHVLIEGAGGWEVPYLSDDISDHVTKPFLLLQHNWFKMMEYSQNDLLNYYSKHSSYPVYKIAFQYAADNEENKAALNFHLTKREEKDIMQSVFSTTNQTSFYKMLELFKHKKLPDTTSVNNYLHRLW